MSVFLFYFIILIDDHLSSLSSAFSLPSPLRVDILVFVFFVSFMSSLVSRIIASFPCDVLLVSIDSDRPSILKRNFQAKSQVLCGCVYASVCFFLSCLLLHLNLVVDCWSYWKYRISLSVPLISAFFGFILIASPIPLKSINSSGGRIHLPWYNLLCYSPLEAYHSASMYRLRLSSPYQYNHCVYFIMSLGGCRQQKFVYNL